jgi:hypothetical protein
MRLTPENATGTSPERSVAAPARIVSPCTSTSMPSERHMSTGDRDVADARDVVEDHFVVGEQRRDDLLRRSVLRAAGPDGPAERRPALDPVAGHPGLRGSGAYFSDDVDVGVVSVRLVVSSTYV